ncbi:MAG: type II secretion system protein M [Verrucomicrobia bacterium]|nr:type II secretion system protein M [Verrucomicrobiota bacterium]
MSKLPREKRDRIILVVGATAITVIALWFLLVSPLRGKVARVAKETEDARSQYNKGRELLASTNKVALALASASERLKTAEGAMATGDLYAWMIQTMNHFKLSYAVDIPQISREMPSEVGTFPDFPYKAATFIVRGTAFYHDFGKFLADFENAFPYMRVQNLELDPSPGQKAEDSEKLSFKLELVTLIKPVTL